MALATATAGAFEDEARPVASAVPASGDVPATATDASKPTAAADAAPAQPIVRTSGRSLVFSGSISPESVARVRSLLHASPQVREVIVTSTGGDVGAGMDFGDLIHAHGLDVRVREKCVSSCANYVFTAGRRKTIEPGALVLWHGSMLQEGLVESFDPSTIRHPAGRPLRWYERWQFRRLVRAEFRVLSARQAGFYDRLGVDGAITVIGQRQGCRCNWTLTVEDMALFGVRDVDAPADYGLPGYGGQVGEWTLVRPKDSGAAG